MEIDSFIKTRFSGVIYETLPISKDENQRGRRKSWDGPRVRPFQQKLWPQKNAKITKMKLQPNGVFAITQAGACVVQSSDYPAIQKSTLLATQSGPMLVIDVKIHPVFKPSSSSRLIRNGVGVIMPQHVVFAISEEPVTFYEFALFFRDYFRCKNALFLDGTISAYFLLN